MNEKRTAELKRCVFQPLSLGEVRPNGWLLEQLRIQAAGLTGHLDEFWPDVAQSRWIGGDAEGWERGPYWLDGLVPLAFLLDDEKLKEKAHHWVESILAQQHEDSWIGPVHDVRYGYAYDPWPLFIVLKALTQYFEATGDERIPKAMQRFLRRLDTLLDEQPLRSWARYRWADLVLSIHWLYERTEEAWLLGLAEKLKEQGFDWGHHFKRFPYREKSRREECDLSSHGVNNAMGIKAPGIWYRQSQDLTDRKAVFNIIRALDTYHGQATGMFTCDEHLAGKNPSQGSELCAVVEYMFSLETLLPILGEPELADRLESLAYNALPATISPDMWAHQYDQQVNQVLCRSAKHHPWRAKEPDADTYPWTSNGPEANLFGLEPNFGCCTANMHQGWPKFAAHLWMRSSDDGLAVVAYAPSMVSTEVRGVPVRIVLRTDYPFDEELNFSIHAERPIVFPLHLRVPAWAEGATLQVEGEDVGTVEPGTFHRLEREWREGSSITLRLPLAFRATRRFNNSLSIYRGPLLFALKMGEDWRHLRGNLPHADWEVYPSTAWNYALELDPGRPEQSIRYESGSAGRHPFSPDGAPVVAKVIGRKLPDWELEQNAAAPVPQSPVQSSEPREELTLTPYGSTNLRVAEFPVLEKEP